MSNKTINVLLVEDSDVPRRVGKMMLTQLNCQVDTAESAEAAILLVKKSKYDLIFMDIGLPDRDGLQVTAEIRALESSEDRVPIVALTANYDESYRPDCLAAGMDDFMLKPISKEKSQGMIDKFVVKD